MALALVAANVAIAFAQFVEPLLLGRVVDRLVGSASLANILRAGPIGPPLMLPWGGFRFVLDPYRAL